MPDVSRMWKCASCRPPCVAECRGCTIPRGEGGGYGIFSGDLLLGGVLNVGGVMGVFSWEGVLSVFKLVAIGSAPDRPVVTGCACAFGF